MGPEGHSWRLGGPQGTGNMLARSLVHGAEVMRALVPRATPGIGFKTKQPYRHGQDTRGVGDGTSQVAGYTEAGWGAGDTEGPQVKGGGEVGTHPSMLSLHPALQGEAGLSTGWLIHPAGASHWVPWGLACTRPRASTGPGDGVPWSEGGPSHVAVRFPCF